MAMSILKRCVIAVTGDFGKDRTHSKIRKWVEANGGVFALQVSHEVTHLVCSTEHFKRNAPMVQQAKKLKGVYVVTYDWLEDSLLKKARRPVPPYLLRTQVKIKAKEKAAKKEQRTAHFQQFAEQFAKNGKAFHKEMACSGYHIYRDQDGFDYDVALARIDILNNKNERYALKLWETDVEPRAFACYAMYFSPSSSNCKFVTAPLGSTFDTAFAAFEKFFFDKTHKNWEDKDRQELDHPHAFKYHSIAKAPLEKAAEVAQDVLPSIEGNEVAAQEQTSGPVQV